jgi:FkbM family methyltransferase
VGRSESKLQAAALLLVAGLIVHHASYEAAYGDLTHVELKETGHGYMTFVSPAIAVVLVFALWRFSARLVEARRTGRSSTDRSSFLVTWLSASAVLAATYVVQEGLEAIAFSGHGFDLPGSRIHGGAWLTLLVLTLGAIIALLLRLGERALVCIAGRARRRVRRTRPAPTPRFVAGFGTRLAVMGHNLAGRAPPPAAETLGTANAARRGRGATLRKLRPAKVRSALRRRWFEWRMVRQDYARRTDVVDLGTEYGGWLVPLNTLQPNWTCYSIGVGGDISFDLELVDRYRMAVRCVEPVIEYVEGARETAAHYPHVVVHHAALALEDAPLRMQRTHVVGSSSVSSASLYEGDEFIDVPGRTLESLMAEHDDSHVDLLKVDMEGAEYEWLRHVDLVALGVRVLCIQLHHNEPVRTARRAIADLRAAGFRPVGCRSVIKLTFVREDSSC